IFCCLSTRRPASSTLFPYTTLFRSQKALALANKVWVAGKNPVAVGIQVVSNNVTDHFTVSDQATGYTAFNNIVTVWCICAEGPRSEEHTSELQSRENLVCRLLLEKK